MKIHVFFSLVLFALYTPLAVAQEKEGATNSSVDRSKVKVYLTGEVKNPQAVTLPRNVGLLAAVYAAGGPTTFGSMKRVTLIRGGKVTTYDRLNPPKELITLNSSDIIYIPVMRFGAK